MRRIGASVLVVLAAVTFLLSGYGWWAKRYFLDSERFTSTAYKIVDEESVQQALAVAITEQISEAAGRDLEVAQPFITSITRAVVQSKQFESIFEAAVDRLHEAVVGGRARQAVLDLSDVVDRVRSAVEVVAPNLAEEIPTGQQVRVRIFDETQLDTIYESSNLIEDLVIVLTVLTVALYAGGIALSDRRWRTTALAGWVTFGLFLASLIAVRAGRWVTGSLVDRSEYSDAAQDAYKVISRGLVLQGVVFSVLGLVVALAAGWIDRHGGWAAVTHATGRGRARAAGRAPEPAPDGAPGAAGEPSGSAREVVAGVLAPRLPAPDRRARTVHWWRAAGLAVVGILAVLSPGSLTSIVVVGLGIVAIYLAITEVLAARAAPKDGDGDTEASPAPSAGPPTGDDQGHEAGRVVDP